MKTYMQEWAEAFRPLSQEELEREVRAMRWLYFKKGISIDRICSLTMFQIKENHLTQYYSTKHFRFCRRIPIAGTPLEEQIKALPNLKSRCRVFPKQVWTKRAAQGFGVPTWEKNEIRELLGLKTRKRLEEIVEKKDKKIVLTVDF